MRPRADDVEYGIDHWGECFVVLTNLDAPDFRIMTAPLDAPGEWAELLAHVPGRRFTQIEPFAGHLVLHEWSEAQPKVRVRFHDGTEHVLDFGPEPHDLELGYNPEWSTTSLRVAYTSLTTPASVFDVDVESGDRVLRKQTPTPNIDLEKYTSVRTWATAPDGTKIPMDVVRHVDTPFDGTAPGPRCTATGPTSCRSRRTSPPPGRRCSTAATCGPWCTHVAAASSVVAGGSTAV